MFDREAVEYNVCAFLYDPSISIRFPKHKVLLVYEGNIINVLGCSILLRSDLDRTALAFALDDSKKYKRNLNNYFIYIFKDNVELGCLKFNEKKYLFEVK
jgi:hypothetical protein